jgi:hypothetical protein
MGILDRFAYQVQASRTAAVGGSDVWTRCDAVGDETFENRVKGVNATALDTAIEAMNIGQFDAMRTWLNELVQYCNDDVRVSGIDGYLTALKWRIDQRAAAIITNYLGANAISITNVHASADGGAAAPGLALGTFIKGGSVVGAADIDITAAAVSVILARVTTIAAADWTITPTVKVVAGTNKAIEQVVLGTGNGGAVGDTYVLGAEAVGGAGAAAEQAVIPVAATAQFSVGQTVLITQWSGSAPNEVWLEQEWGVIKTGGIIENTSIELESNLLHSYTSAGYVYPCCTGIVSCTSSGGTASDAVAFFPAPDRRLKL